MANGKMTVVLRRIPPKPGEDPERPSARDSVREDWHGKLLERYDDIPGLPLRFGYRGVELRPHQRARFLRGY